MTNDSTVGTTTGTADNDKSSDVLLAELLTLSEELLDCFDGDGNIEADKVARLSANTDAKTRKTFEDVRARILDRLDKLDVYDGKLLDLEGYTSAFLNEAYALAESLEDSERRCESLERQRWQLEFSRHERSILDACDSISEDVSALTNLLDQTGDDGTGTIPIPASKWRELVAEVNSCATRVVEIMEKLHQLTA